MDGEIDAARQHEDDGDELDQRAVEIGETGIMGREAAGGDGGEGMADGVEETHPGEPERQCAGAGQADIEHPQRTCRLRDPGRGFLVLGDPGGLRPIQLHPADAHERQDRDGEDDDAHSPEPLDLLAMIEDGRGEIVQPDDDRGAGGGESRDGLEDGVGEAQVQSEQEGQCADHSQHGPEKGDDEKALAHGQLALLAAVRQPQQHPGGGAQQQRESEHAPLAVRVDQRRRDRGKEAQAIDQQQDTEQTKDGAPMHPISNSFDSLCRVREPFAQSPRQG